MPATLAGEDVRHLPRVDLADQLGGPREGRVARTDRGVSDERGDLPSGEGISQGPGEQRPDHALCLSTQDVQRTGSGQGGISGAFDGRQADPGAVAGGGTSGSRAPVAGPRGAPFRCDGHLLRLWRPI